jgi:hypothetical protein
VTNRVPRTDRRGALRTAAIATLALPALPLAAACDATDTTPHEGRIDPTAGAAAADQALVDAVARRIAGLRQAATSLARHDHAHRSWLLAVAALHEQHLRKLGATGARPRAARATSVAALTSAERSLQQTLVAASSRAASGALAQVLASMAAAIEQRLAVA